MDVELYCCYSLPLRNYLLEIPYWDFDDIEEILKQKLSINNFEKAV